MMRTLFVPASILVVVAALAGAADGQRTYGFGTPGTGGIVPRLTSAQPYMGNGGYSLDVGQGLGGVGGFMLLSLFPAADTIGGTPIWVSTAPASNLLLADFITLGGAPGAAGQGSLAFPLPLAFAPLPQIAGFKLYAQAVLLDLAGGSPAVTNGLEIELVMPPEVFVGSSVGGSSDRHWFVDVLAQAQDGPTGQGIVDNADEAVFTNGGTQLFVNSTINGTIMRADLTGAAPQWSVFAAFPGGGSNGCKYDRHNRIIYSIGDLGAGFNELVAFDADLASPTFGQVVGSGNASAGGIIGAWALSPSGRLAVVPGVLSPIVFVYDTDPASPTYLQSLLSYNVPSSPASTLWLNSACGITPDDDQIMIIRQGTGSTPAEVARFSFSVGGLIDHNPATPQIDNMGQFSFPPIPFGSAPTSLEMADIGGPFFVVGGFGNNGWAGRVDYDALNPAFFQYTPATGTVFTDSWNIALNPVDSMVAVTSFPEVTVNFFDAATMSFQFSVQLPSPSMVSGSNIGGLAYR